MSRKQCVPGIVWALLDPVTKLVLLADRQIEIDDDGHPMVRSERLAAVVAKIEEALLPTGVS
jgi:hypothetical protein